MLHVILTCMSILHAHTMQNYMHVACMSRKQVCHMNLPCMLHACFIKHAWKLHVTCMLHAQHFEQRIMTCVIRINYIFSYVVNLLQHYEHHYNLAIKITLTY